MTSATAAAGRIGKDIRQAALAYLRLTKPRIVSLLVVTTIPAMILAKDGMPSPWLVLATVGGGAIAAGGANAMNMFFDRDIDEVMRRTRGRPVPSGQVDPERAAVFGLALGALGFVILSLFANLLAAGLTLGAYLFYVVVYTILLKRSTPLNIVIGGAAGAMPPVVGWAAVTGGVGVAAIIMFFIVTLWTPPHFWALALNYSSDYKKAGVPMLPVVAGPKETGRQVLWHTLGLVAVSLLLPIWSPAGLVYELPAAALGAVFVYYAAALWKTGSGRSAWALFRYSIIYLALLFAAIAIDGLV